MNKDNMLSTSAALLAGAGGAETVAIVKSLLARSFSWQEVVLVAVLVLGAVGVNYVKYSGRGQVLCQKAVPLQA